MGNTACNNQLQSINDFTNRLAMEVEREETHSLSMDIVERKIY